MKIQNVDYFPCLECSKGEHIAYRNLSDEDKAALLPTFEITQTKSGADFQDSVDEIQLSASDAGFILDLSRTPAPNVYIPSGGGDEHKIAALQEKQDNYNERRLSLYDTTDGFENWRNLVRGFGSSCIPALQFSNPIAEMNDIVRQCMLLKDDGFGVQAIRIKEEYLEQEELFILIGLVSSILDSQENLIVLIDAGQGRSNSVRANALEFAKSALEKISSRVSAEKMSLLNTVFVFDTFSNPTRNYLQDVYDNYSWEIWEDLSSDYAIKFGDYVGKKRRVSSSTYIPPDWKATVSYPLDMGWLHFKDVNTRDEAGWVEGANAILESDRYVEPSDCWGQTVIENAANGDITGVDSARFWHGAKFNIHMHRQILNALTIMYL